MDHYQVLQVSPQATQQEIKQSYRRLAKQFHPDHQINSNNSERIIALNAAYEILGDRQNRRRYDRQQQLGYPQDFYANRQARNAAAQKQYQRQRDSKPAEVTYERWLKEVYLPIHRLVSKIIPPLETEIDCLSADPFDDGLMGDFEAYLDTCEDYWQQAQQKIASQPNPPQVAGVASNLYYCLNHIGDGIKELKWFTMNYNDQYLHTGQEIFRIAARLHQQAQARASSFL
ncbi:MAG: DnaJ domain-containing protein [Cyanobacteria bacterium J06621_8]